ncbi:GIY-YIG nuclease family protein [Occallatibacter savannae]|uniref:GIY-YIG nuclease family protein n=1 Tax=Occallatibacter savannae TaxID=1002691 RepID=UPI000D68E702|nr:GIY-YIG nuclease family protein [Occallatibacter savannae]
MREHVYFTYIVASKSRTLYIGVTSDLRHRVFEHKTKAYEGFTSRYNCNRLVWFERSNNVSAAIQREKELKGWLRSKKVELIQAANPTWEDLSADWFPHLTREVLETGAYGKADPSLR